MTGGLAGSNEIIARMPRDILRVKAACVCNNIQKKQSHVTETGGHGTHI